MKRLFLILIISVLYFNIYAQTSNDLIIEHLEKMSEDSEEEYSDYSELLESYWSITENPTTTDTNLLTADTFTTAVTLSASSSPAKTPMRKIS